MLYGNHGSKGREWLGTMINGGNGQGGDIMVGWRGWMRVEREEGVGFEVRTSAEEAVGERTNRWDMMEARGWRAVCGGGKYCWE